jgi:protein pelota
MSGVREAGGEVFVFSAMHVSGEQLSKLTGIAAILRFPLTELEDQEIEAPW